MRDPGILSFFLDRCLWPQTATETKHGIRAAALAIRLAGNCCLDSEDVQILLSDHLDRIQDVLKIPELLDVSIGLVANMIFDDASVVEASDLLNKGFHETITAHLRPRGTHEASHNFHETALEITNWLAEEDGEMKTPNVSASAAAIRNLAKLLDRNELSIYDDQDQSATIKIVTQFLQADKTWPELLKDESYEDCAVLSRIYCKTMHPNLVKLDVQLATGRDWIDEEVEALSRLESVLGELAAQIARESTGLASNLSSNHFFAQAVDFIRTSDADNAIFAAVHRTIAFGYLILCNLCTDEFATAVVRDYKLHQDAVAIFRESIEDGYDSAHKNAAAFLANLCQPMANKRIIAESGIISELFYDNPNVQPSVPIHMVRKLIANVRDVDWLAAAMSERGAIPSFKDILSHLPNQKVAQDESNAAAAGAQVLGTQQKPSPTELLTKDIGHIYVDLRRQRTVVNTIVTTELVWCLVSLIMIGSRTRNALDISDGVLGLGLAIKNVQGVAEPLAVAAIEALQYAGGLQTLKSVVQMGAGDATSVAKRVAENATNVLSVLVSVAERKRMAEDVVQEMKDVMRLGVKIKMEGSET